MTRVQLLQLDGSLPNIALLRVAAHHRDLGDEVSFRRATTVAAVSTSDLWDGAAPDLVYASLIFERTRPVAEALKASRPDALIGGTGWDVARPLEPVGITTTRQDYSIVPEFHSSIGFTQRGCRLRCSFCVVPRKEGAVREEQTIADIWRGEPWPRQILLLDNDFFGQPHWRERIAELRAGSFKVCFSQGINARMLSDEAAAAIASVDYRDDSFKVRRIYTAWDSRPDERVLFRGLERLVAHGVKPDQIMVYILVGHAAGETHKDRDYRRQRLREFGARPYPMPFVRTPELVGFQRWVIGAYDKRVPWNAWAGARFQPRNLGDATGRQSSLPLPVLSASAGGDL